ncbi:MAG: flavin prenyltransferase UbiX [Halofilum sp. (in: g-proteobacteria)]|nr:flavin prenyltransferase UbiX [Halofilum sp. (in: g-proteobacteria)]
MSAAPRIALAITGASGVQYALRLLGCLLDGGCHVYLLVSKPGQVVIGMDTDLKVPGRVADMQRFFAERHADSPGTVEVLGMDQWTAPIASGSGAPDAMVICPCTTGTLAAVATGQCGSLLERAADVVLKERRRLVVMPREMPFSEIHLENMLRLARMGAVIMPPNPGFYNRPGTIDELVDFVVARVLDHLDVPHRLVPRWGLDDGA